jgi:hypothetical protein
MPPTLLELRMEGDKLLHYTMKQLVTISSGSILIIIALLIRFLRRPNGRCLWGSPLLDSSSAFSAA